MADKISKEKRSQLMSKIKSNDTAIEIQVRRWLFSNGFRFRKNDKRYPGNPDIVLPKYKTAIYVNGCFWHGHSSKECKIQHIPKTNTEYWQNKIDKNKKNDLKHYAEMRELGWKVIVVWECELQNNSEKYLKSLTEKIIGTGKDISY